MKNPNVSDLSKVDLNIIKRLRQNGRLPNSQLAQAVGLSATACAARVKGLERKGIIKGYSAVIDEQMLYGENIAFVQVRLNSTSAQALEVFHRAIELIAEVEQCHMMAADFDYLLKVRSINMSDFRRVLADKISSLPHVKQTSTFIAMAAVKE